MLLNFCDYICYLYFLLCSSLVPISLHAPGIDFKRVHGLACTPSISLSNILKGGWASLISQTHDQQSFCLEAIEVCQQKTCMLHQRGASRKSCPVTTHIRSPGSRMSGVTRK